MFAPRRRTALVAVETIGSRANRAKSLGVADRVRILSAADRLREQCHSNLPHSRPPHASYIMI
jgi:hypothetical protein